MSEPWPVLCSTGAFTRERSNFPDYRAILQYGPTLAVDGLELLFYHQWYDQFDQVAADLYATGLRFPVIHAEKSIGPALGSAEPEQQAEALRKLRENCRLGQQLGVELLVLHLWGLPGSDEQLERNLSLLGECLRIAADAGLAVAVETIPCLRADPLTNIRRTLEQDARARVALDTEFLALHGQLDEALASDWLWQEGRVTHIHIKDYDGQMADASGHRRYLHPGEGQIDFSRFFDRLAQRGFAGTISLEASAVQPDGWIDLPRLHASLAGLRRLVADGRRPA
jgi:sugar phosphate isomerase/epimerase